MLNPKILITLISLTFTVSSTIATAATTSNVCLPASSVNVRELTDGLFQMDYKDLRILYFKNRLEAIEAINNSILAAQSSKDLCVSYTTIENTRCYSTEKDDFGDDQKVCFFYKLDQFVNSTSIATKDQNEISKKEISKFLSTSTNECFTASDLRIEVQNSGDVIQLYYKNLWMRDFYDRTTAAVGFINLEKALREKTNLCFNKADSKIKTIAIANNKIAYKSDYKSNTVPPTPRINEAVNEAKKCFPASEMRIEIQSDGRIVQVYYQNLWLKDFSDRVAAATGMRILDKAKLSNKQFCYDNSILTIPSTWIEN